MASTFQSTGSGRKRSNLADDDVVSILPPFKRRRVDQSPPVSVVPSNARSVKFQNRSLASINERTVTFPSPGPSGLHTVMPTTKNSFSLASVNERTVTFPSPGPSGLHTVMPTTKNSFSRDCPTGSVESNPRLSKRPWKKEPEDNYQNRKRTKSKTIAPPHLQSPERKIMKQEKFFKGKKAERGRKFVRCQKQGETRSDIRSRNQARKMNHMDFCDPQDLTRLLRCDIKQQVEHLIHNRTFEIFLQSPSNSTGTDLSLITRLLSRVARCEVGEQNKFVQCVIPKLFMLENQSFLNGLRSYLCSLPTENDFAIRMKSISFLEHVHCLFKVILETEPINLPALTALPIDAFWGAMRQLKTQEIRFQDISEKAQQLLEKRDEIRMTLYETAETKAYGYDNVVLPTREELEQKTLPGDLQRNIIKGAFPSVEAYFEIQYHLLREDFIHPLRCALHNIEFDGEEGLDLKVCHALFRDRVFSLHEECVFEIEFEAQTQSHIKWDRSKRFMHGSLLCLMEETFATDKFATILFATVAERDVEMLQKGRLHIKLETLEAHVSLSPVKKYIVIESPGFYAAYAPVLRSLYEAAHNPNRLPFSKYIVECKTDIDFPAYVKGKKEFQLNLQHLDESNEERNHKVNILDEAAYSDFPMTKLDDSQKKALYSALTRELTVIQGPPGTGKSYIGVKIVETLLKNRSSWDNDKSPIVIVCYTNHALDQFLEEIIGLNCNKRYFDQKLQIRRVGGCSKNPMVSEYNLLIYVKKLLRKRKIFGKKKSNYQLRQRIDALNDLLESHFDPRKLKQYASLMASDVCYFVQRQCNNYNICNDPISLATWLDPNTFQVEPEVSYFDYSQEVEAERRVATEIDEDCFPLFRQFGKNTMHKFFETFAKVKLLSSLPNQAPKEDMEMNPMIDIDLHDRPKFFKHCLQQFKPELEKQLEVGRHQEKEYGKHRQMAMIRCLKEADIVGLTTTGAAKHNALLREIEAKIVIIEEAAEVLEAHVISTLTPSTQQLILIGDHKQLQPRTNDYSLARDYHLNVSLFERLILNGFPHITLQVQHRMRPEISALVSSKIYNNCLQDGNSTTEYPPVQGVNCNLFFIDHTSKETPNADLKSPQNDHEATFLACFAKYLLQQGSITPSQITVITPYTGQMYNLREKFAANNIKEIKIIPIDSYQGEENDIILLSLVRSEKPGFVRDEHRICVALSRAKHGLFVIGNFNLFTSTSKLWRSIIEDIRSQNKIGRSLPLKCKRHEKLTMVTMAEDFNQVGEGGCSLPCNFRLECGHMCPLKCHTDKIAVHDTYMCKEPCSKRCPQGHRCKKQCFQGCGLCDEILEKRIPQCGHPQPVPCSCEPENFTCQEPCTKELECGHRCKKKCGEAHTTECRKFVEKKWPCEHTAQAECYVTKAMYSRICTMLCNQELSCGHPCSGTCGECRQGRLHKPCTAKCDRIFSCGHKCTNPCAQSCPSCNKECMFECPHGPCGHKCNEPCRPCAHECTLKCDHKQCTRNCGEPCDTTPCNKPCSKNLPCGHPCMGMCGEICPNVCQVCDKNKWGEKVLLIFGTEDLENNPELKIIQMDCDCKFEVSAMDRFMREPKPEDKVEWKRCLICRKCIFQTKRYMDINKATKNDLNQIKTKQCSSHDHDEMMRTVIQLAQCSSLIKDLQKFMKCIKFTSSKRLYAEYSFLLAEKRVQAAIKEMDERVDTNSPHRAEQHDLCIAVQDLKAQYEDFIKKLFLYRHKASITDQMLEDVQAEKNRIVLLATIYKIEEQRMKEKVNLSSNDVQFLHEVRKVHETHGNQLHTKACDATFHIRMAYIKGLKKKHPELESISSEEKQMILKAMKTKAGSWYRCKNGHLYNIGECGGGMVTSQCPTCNASIGGRNHQLLAENSHAGDFDGSSQPAWPV